MKSITKKWATTYDRLLRGVDNVSREERLACIAWLEGRARQACDEREEAVKGLFVEIDFDDFQEVEIEYVNVFDGQQVIGFSCGTIHIQNPVSVTNELGMFEMQKRVILKAVELYRVEEKYDLHLLLNQEGEYFYYTVRGNAIYTKSPSRA